MVNFECFENERLQMKASYALGFLVAILEVLVLLPEKFLVGLLGINQTEAGCVYGTKPKKILEHDLLDHSGTLCSRTWHNWQRKSLDQEKPPPVSPVQSCTFL